MCRKITNLIIVFSLALLLFSCGGSSGSSSSDDSTPTATVSNIVSTRSTADAGHMFDLSYDISSNGDMENVVVSFYLSEADDSRAVDTSDNISFKELLGVDVIENLNSNIPRTHYVSFRVPDNLPSGNYYIDAYVNEYLGNEDVIRASSMINLDNSTASVTELRITEVEMENSQIILDPYLDILRGMEVSNILKLSNIQALADNTTFSNMVIQGLVSEPEINGTVTVEVDGALPTDPINLSFEYSLDNGANWHNLKWWDNDLGKYTSYVTVEFSDFDNGTREQSMDFDIDISPQTMLEVFNAIVASGVSSGLEGFSGLKTRIKVASGSINDTYELNLPVYIVPTTVADLTTIIGYMDNVTTCVSDLTACGSTLPTTPTLPEGIVLSKSSSQSRRADETLDRVSEKNWSRWSGRKKYFKIGASYEHKFAIYNGNPRTGYYGAYAKVHFNIPMYIFREKFNIIDAYLRGSAYAKRADNKEALYTGYKYYLDVFADTVVSGEEWAGSVTFGYGDDFYKKKMLAETWLWVGPMPFKVEAGVKGDIGYDVSLNLNLEDGITLTNELPTTYLKLYVEGGPDVFVLSYGIGANLGLIEDTLTTSINLSYDYDESLNRMTGANYDIAITNDTKMIWGEFYLYYTYWKCKITGCKEKRRQRTIHNTKPYRDWLYTLYSKSESLFDY